MNTTPPPESAAILAWMEHLEAMDQTHRHAAGPQNRPLDAMTTQERSEAAAFAVSLGISPGDAPEPAPPETQT